MVQPGNNGHEGVEVVQLLKVLDDLDELFQDLDPLLDPGHGANLRPNPEADLVEPADVICQVFRKIRVFFLARIPPKVDHQLLGLNLFKVLEFDQGELLGEDERVQRGEIDIAADGHGLLNFLLFGQSAELVVGVFSLEEKEARG